jgi:hypothetical protein
MNPKDLLGLNHENINTGFSPSRSSSIDHDECYIVEDSPAEGRILRI